MLCVALVFVFASASMTKMVDHNQHQSGGSSNHDHMMFSQIVFETSEHHDPHATDSDGRSAPDHQPGTGHHHHADSGSGLLVAPSQESPWAFSRASAWQPMADSRMSGFLIHGPERPPKSSAIPV